MDEDTKPSEPTSPDNTPEEPSWGDEGGGGQYRGGAEGGDAKRRSRRSGARGVAPSRAS